MKNPKNKFFNKDLEFLKYLIIFVFLFVILGLSILNSSKNRFIEDLQNNERIYHSYLLDNKKNFDVLENELKITGFNLDRVKITYKRRSTYNGSLYIRCVSIHENLEKNNI